MLKENSMDMCLSGEFLCYKLVVWKKLKNAKTAFIGLTQQKILKNLKNFYPLAKKAWVWQKNEVVSKNYQKLLDKIHVNHNFS